MLQSATDDSAASCRMSGATPATCRKTRIRDSPCRRRDAPRADIPRRSRIVRHKRQIANQRLNLPPHLGKRRRIAGVVAAQAVYLHTKPAVIVGDGVNQTVKPVDNLAASYNHDTHRTDARAALVGCLEIDCCKIIHILLLQIKIRSCALNCCRPPTARHGTLNAVARTKVLLRSKSTRPCVCGRYFRFVRR